ncbi:hypothetical protein [Campylobacter iguaniorum]|uniref:hypothetical protein n=1 Tax=Campylobacter iguaniorum TaxID=1244531 RepID=UPI0012E3B6D2|nr:hypothetical protein [Campylobacter iguaniorum]
MFIFMFFSVRAKLPRKNLLLAVASERCKNTKVSTGMVTLVVVKFENLNLQTKVVFEL